MQQKRRGRFGFGNVSAVGRGACGVHGGDDLRQGFFLLAIQRQRLGGKQMFAGVRIAFGDGGADGYRAARFHAPQCFRGGVGQFQELLQRQFLALVDDLPNLRLAFGQAASLRIDCLHADAQLPFPAFLLLADRLRQDTFEGEFQRAAIILADPAGQIEHGGRHQGLVTQ